MNPPEPNTGRGGDFHNEFWADAKGYALRGVNLSESTAARVEANRARARLYPLLTEGFLLWWNDRRRWRNAPIQEGQKLRGRYEVGDLGVVVKVSNFLTVSDDHGLFRAIYPYCAEEPGLTDEAARVGLWLCTQTFPAISAEDFRLIDVLRSRAFSLTDLPLQGDEEEIFLEKYRFLLSEKERLYADYR